MNPLSSLPAAPSRVTESDRSARYAELVDQRKACGLCPCLQNASRINGGRLDSSEVGPYTRWQGNLRSELLVVAQDFPDVDSFVEHRGWPGERVDTNLTLVDLVAEAGIKIAPPRYGVADDRLFFTNAVLCMKRGGMQAAVPDACYAECGRRFLRPTIDLVSPKLVVTLGRKAMAAVCDLYKVPRPRKFRDAVAKPIRLAPAMLLMPVYHPSPTVLNTHRSPALQREDWRHVGRVLSALAAA